MKLGITEDNFEEEQGLNTGLMPFGLHKDKKIEDIPFDYIWWLYHEVDMFSWLKKIINEIFERKMTEKVTCFGGWSEMHFEQEDECATCDLIKKCKEIDTANNEDDWEEKDEDDNISWLD